MKRILTYIFLITESLLYICFVAGDIFSVGQPKILKFIAIALLAIFSLQCGKSKENKTATLIFFFTLIADIFFVLMNKPFYGIAVYIIIQLLHTVRLSYIGRKNIKKELLIRVVPSVILCAIGSFVGPMVALILPYALCIGINIAHVIQNNVLYPSKSNLRYAIAMIVLVIGDIGVGIRNLQLDFITPEIMNTAYIITWITYLPSLLLILSTTDALYLKNKQKLD